MFVCQKFWGNTPVHVSNFSKRVQHLKTTSNEARHTLVKFVHPKWSLFLLSHEAYQLRQHKYRALLHNEVEIQTLEVSSNGKTEALVSLGKKKKRILSALKSWKNNLLH